MAFTAAIAPREKGLFKGLAPFFSALGAALVAFMENQSRASEVTRLNEMSDAELAERGINRDRIVYHVFRDRFYV